MMKFLKYFAYLLVGVILFSIAFFFWASAPKLNDNQYSELIYNEAQLSEINDSVFSILTYNIGYLSGLTNNKAVERSESLFKENLERVKRRISSLKPNIVAFQEIDFRSERSFNTDQHQALASLGFPFGAKAINWDERYVPFPYFPVSMHFGEILSGQSVLSDFKIKDQNRIVLDRVEDIPFWRDAFYLDRLAQVVTVIVHNTECKLINVHLEAFDKITREKQSQKVAEIYKKWASKYPTFLLGDFNSDIEDSGATIKHLQTISGIQMAVSNISLKTYPSDKPTEKLDYIFYNEKFIEKISASVEYDFSDISDHIPVLMRFKLK